MPKKIIIQNKELDDAVKWILESNFYRDTQNIKLTEFEKTNPPVESLREQARNYIETNNIYSYDTFSKEIQLGTFANDGLAMKPKGFLDSHLNEPIFPENMPALYWAIRNAHQTRFQWLLSEGADPKVVYHSSSGIEYLNTTDFLNEAIKWQGVVDEYTTRNPGLMARRLVAFPQMQQSLESHKSTATYNKPAYKSTTTSTTLPNPAKLSPATATQLKPSAAIQPTTLLENASNALDNSANKPAYTGALKDFLTNLGNEELEKFPWSELIIKAIKDEKYNVFISVILPIIKGEGESAKTRTLNLASRVNWADLLETMLESPLITTPFIEYSLGYVLPMMLAECKLAVKNITYNKLTQLKKGNNKGTKWDSSYFNYIINHLSSLKKVEEENAQEALSQSMLRDSKGDTLAHFRARTDCFSGDIDNHFSLCNPEGKTPKDLLDSKVPGKCQTLIEQKTKAVIKQLEHVLEIGYEFCPFPSKYVKNPEIIAGCLYIDIQLETEKWGLAWLDEGEEIQKEKLYITRKITNEGSKIHCKFRLASGDIHEITTNIDAPDAVKKVFPLIQAFDNARKENEKQVEKLKQKHKERAKELRENNQLDQLESLELELKNRLKTYTEQERRLDRKALDQKFEALEVLDSDEPPYGSDKYSYTSYKARILNFIKAQQNILLGGIINYKTTYGTSRTDTIVLPQNVIDCVKSSMGNSDTVINSMNFINESLKDEIILKCQLSNKQYHNRYAFYYYAAIQVLKNTPVEDSPASVCFNNIIMWGSNKEKLIFRKTSSGSPRTTFDSFLKEERLALLDLLILKGAHPNYANEGGISPLHYACLEDDINLFEFLQYRPEITGLHKTKQKNQTPLHWAVIRLANNEANLDAQQYKIEKLVADWDILDCRDSSGHTALDLLEQIIRQEEQKFSQSNERLEGLKKIRNILRGVSHSNRPHHTNTSFALDGNQYLEVTDESQTTSASIAPPGLQGGGIGRKVKGTKVPESIIDKVEATFPIPPTPGGQLPNYTSNAPQSTVVAPGPDYASNVPASVQVVNKVETKQPGTTSKSLMDEEIPDEMKSLPSLAAHHTPEYPSNASTANNTPPSYESNPPAENQQPASSTSLQLDTSNIHGSTTGPRAPGLGGAGSVPKKYVRTNIKESILENPDRNSSSKDEDTSYYGHHPHTTHHPQHTSKKTHFETFSDCLNEYDALHASWHVAKYEGLKIQQYGPTWKEVEGAIDSLSNKFSLRTETLESGADLLILIKLKRGLGTIKQRLEKLQNQCKTFPTILHALDKLYSTAPSNMAIAAMTEVHAKFIADLKKAIRESVLETVSEEESKLLESPPSPTETTALIVTKEVLTAEKSFLDGLLDMIFPKKKQNVHTTKTRELPIDVEVISAVTNLILEAGNDRQLETNVKNYFNKRYDAHNHGLFGKKLVLNINKALEEHEKDKRPKSSF